MVLCGFELFVIYINGQVRTIYNYFSVFLQIQNTDVGAGAPFPGVIENLVVCGIVNYIG